MHVVVNLNCPAGKVRHPHCSPRVVPNGDVARRLTGLRDLNRLRVQAWVRVGQLEVSVFGCQHRLAFNDGDVADGERCASHTEAAHWMGRGAIA